MPTPNVMPRYVEAQYFSWMSGTAQIAGCLILIFTFVYLIVARMLERMSARLPSRDEHAMARIHHQPENQAGDIEAADTIREESAQESAEESRPTIILYYPISMLGLVVAALVPFVSRFVPQMLDPDCENLNKPIHELPFIVFCLVNLFLQLLLAFVVLIWAIFLVIELKVMKARFEVKWP